MLEKEYSLQQIHDVARELLQDNLHRIVLFQANMGCGKTTLIRALAEVLGTKQPVSSPTFSLVNEYLCDSGETLYHFDFYRIKNIEEAFDMGIEEYLYSGAWCFVEWAENIEEIIPKSHSVVQLSLLPNHNRLIRHIRKS